MAKRVGIPRVSNNPLIGWLPGAVLLAGAGLRLYRLTHLGLVHFDEGVYALSGFWAITPWKAMHLYPKQIFFSPPLFISLVGISYWLRGMASDTAVILVNVVVGTATIALAWWFARCWFGAGAGIAVAILVALSNYHIAFSRAALTDTVFGFVFLLSVAAITVALEKGSLGWAVVAGLASGAAWNTKYHGWLPVAVALVVLLFLAGFGRLERPTSKRLFLCWVILAGVAAASYLPWAMYIQMHPGGYLAFAAYQRKFLSRHWLQDLLQQVEMQWYFDGWLSRVSPAGAYLVALVAGKGPRLLAWKRCWPAIALLLASGLVLGGSGTTAILAILAVPILLRRGGYASWLLVGSLSLLFLLLPAYRPYSRLFLPLLLCMQVAAGVAISETSWAGEAQEPARPSGRVKTLTWVVAGAVAVSWIALGLRLGFRLTPRTWMDTDSVRQAVAAMTRQLPERSVVFVHGAPEVAFYFRRASYEAILIDYPIDHPEVQQRFHPGGPKHFLVTAIYSQREPMSHASLKRLGDRLELLGAFPIQPSDVRLLDDFSPRGALQYLLHPTAEYDLHLYRVPALEGQ